MARVFVAGATGFIGSHLVRILLDRGHHVRCLARSTQSAERCRSRGVEPFNGNVNDPPSLRGAMDGITVAVNLTGIIEEKGSQTFDAVHVEGTRALVNEARNAGIEHFIQQSALGASRDSQARYHSTKAEGERIVSGSGIPHTVFRPSLVIGPGDGFTQKLTGIIRSPAPVIPIPGPGKARFQPIYVEDLVRCFMAVIEDAGKRDKVYELGGPEQLAYNDIVSELARAMGSKKRIVHVPMGIAALGVRLLEHTPFRQATSEQLSLLNIDNICDPDSVKNQFGFEPVRFAEALEKFISPQE